MSNATPISAKEKRLLAKQEANKKAKKTLRITIIVIVVCALLLAAALTINSNFMRRQGKAFSINGMDFTPAEFTFHFYNYYYEYVQYVYTEVPDYANMLLPSSSTSMEAQQYDDGVTWKDHFMEYTESCLKDDTALYNAGKAAGFEMSAEQQQALEDEIANLETQAASYGYSNVDKLIKKTYGDACTESILKEQLAFLYYADAYEDACVNGISFSDEEIQAGYEAKKDMYDLFSYRYFIVYSDSVDETQYEDDEDGLAAAKEAAVAEAHKIAAEYQAKIKNTDDFIAAARDYDAEKYESEESTLREYDGNLLGSTYGPWLRDASRKSGDVELFDISVGVYVVMFEGRTDNGYNTVNLRTILVTPSTVDSEDYEDEEDDTAYNEAVAKAKSDAEASIDEIYEQFKSDPTEDTFIQLATDKSDSANASNGGLWENASHTSFTEEITEWLFDSARKNGDTEKFWSEGAGGYYLLYFLEEDMPYNKYLANKAMVSDAETEWRNSLESDESGTRTWMYSLA